MGGKFSESIKDKELLTFSNLMNLEWQFVNYVKKRNEKTKLPEIYHNLSTLLHPKYFITGPIDKNGKVIEGMEEFVYIDEKQKETVDAGFAKLKALAPIAMEYNELLKGEGAFLEEWEVVFINKYKLLII